MNDPSETTDRTFPCGHTPEDCICDPTPEQEAEADIEEAAWDAGMGDDDMLAEYDGADDCPFCEGERCNECDWTGEYR